MYPISIPTIVVLIFIGLFTFTIPVSPLLAEKANTHKNHNNNDNISSDQNDKRLEILTAGNQIISCGGDLASCQNVLTNVICAHVTYCIIGDITPFLMANPT
jgi:hypothetical protein